MIKQHGNQAGQKQITLWLFYGMVTAIMWGLKQHYSNAVADDLMWILNPVAAIVEAVDGLAYTWQVGVGWVRSDGFIIIAKSCAGVNFMIMLFGLSTIAFLHRLKDLRWQLLWLIVVMLAAYAISIGINSLRIMISIILYENHWSWQWFTPERLHRVL
ncbi:MAG: exosortase K, partial [Desulfobacteraceae bacterium]